MKKSPALRSFIFTFTILALGFLVFPSPIFALSWSQVASNGVTSPHNNMIFRFGIFQNTLYAAAGSATAWSSSLWKSNDGQTWSEVVTDNADDFIMDLTEF